MMTALIWFCFCWASSSPHYATGVQKRSGGERYCSGSAQSHTRREGSDGARGLPLLLGYCRPIRLGEWVQFIFIFLNHNYNHCNKPTLLGSLSSMAASSLVCIFTPAATIENFNVVETLSDNAVIVYQTHKVNWLQLGYRLRCLVKANVWYITACVTTKWICLCYRGCGPPLRETCSICQPSERSWQQTKMIPTLGWFATFLWTMTMLL